MLQQAFAVGALVLVWLKGLEHSFTHIFACDRSLKAPTAFLRYTKSESLPHLHRIEAMAAAETTSSSRKSKLQKDMASGMERCGFACDGLSNCSWHVGYCGGCAVLSLVFVSRLS